MALLPPTYREAPADPRQSLMETLGTGLQSFAQSKLQQMAQQKQREQTSTGLQALGYAPEEAQKLSGLPMELLTPVVKQRAAAPSQEAYGNVIGQILGQGQQQGAQPGQGQPMMGGASQEGMPQGQQPISFKGLSEKQMTDASKLIQRQQAASKEEQRYIDKTTEPVYRRAIDEGNYAKKENMYLDRIIKLSEEGDVREGAATELLQKFGLDFQGLRSNDTQEIAKLEKFFLRGGTKMFGGKVSNAEMQAILESVPNLLSSNEGRIQVAKLMKLGNESALLRKQATEEIIADNKGRRPADFESQLEDRVASQEERLARKFINLGFQGKELKDFDPSAVQQFKEGQNVIDDETGQVYRRIGDELVPVEEVAPGKYKRMY